MKTFGLKESFALSISIKDYHTLDSEIDLWIGGDCLSHNPRSRIELIHYIRELYEICFFENLFSNSALTNLSCKEMFHTINPYFHEPDKIYEIAEEEAEKYYTYSKHILSWSIFLRLPPKLVINNEICTFVWTCSTDESISPSDFDKTIRCANVPLSLIRQVYNDLKTFIGSEYWPKEIG